ncbi:hypothetical protein WA538_000400 [Blastocystis sp. DL]
MEEEPAVPSTVKTPPEELRPENAVFKKEEVNPYIKDMQALLESMNVTSYEENVIPFLLEFYSDLRNKLISEAKTYAEVAGSGQITKVHISDATLSILKRNFAMGRTYNGDKEVNESVRLRKDEEGVVLPNQVNLLDTTDPVLELTEK